MFIRSRFPVPKGSQYGETYERLRKMVVTWSDEELREFLSRFSLFQRILMRGIYHPEAPAYYAVKEVLQKRDEEEERKNKIHAP